MAMLHAITASNEDQHTTDAIDAIG